ncbi:MAG: TIGR04290 family methyltransferase [Acidobacteria bacterium]|nr:MAG: TIGR04290 family methyltransferase [Acidobacteriota bacterium]
MTITAQKAIRDLQPWFHNLHLPDGTQTAPDHQLGDFPSFKWKQIARHVPADLKGWRALDIGCNAGFYSFELALRGAHVVGIDIDSHYLRQARWAARQFKLEQSIDLRQMQVYDLAHTKEAFDLVLFMGVYYHLRYPLLALDVVAEKVKRMMIFQSLTMPGMKVYKETEDHDIDDRDVLNEPGWPRMAFIENRFAGDPTNWWIPNHACIEAVLRSAGFHVTARPGHEIYVCKPGKTKSSEWDRREFLSAVGRRA